MAGSNKGSKGSGRVAGGNTAAAKRTSIYRAATARYDQMREASPASRALKNKAMAPNDAARYNRTTVARRAFAVAGMEARRRGSMDIGSGRGSSAVRRAKALGVSPAGQRRIRRVAGA